MRVSISGLDRADACPPSVILPRTHRLTKWSSRGKVLHSFLASAPKLGRDEALGKVPDEHRRACEVLDLSGLPVDPAQFAAEVAFAYHVEFGTAREIGRELDRGYADLLQPGEIPGTADVIGIGHDFVVVVDYKSGWSDLGPVRENLQLRGYALAACRAYGFDRAVIAIVRLKDDGEFFYQRAELDGMDLDATEDRIRSIRDRAMSQALLHEQGVTLEPTAGDHCRYCPALTSCPAQMNLLRVVARTVVASGADLAEDAIMPPVLNEQTAPLVYQRLVLIDELLPKLWDSLREYARLSPIQLPDGRIFGLKQHEERELVPSHAMPALIAKFGESAKTMLKTKTSLPVGAFEDFIGAYVRERKKAGEKLKKGDVVDAVWKELLDAGGALVKTSPRITEHKPKELPGEKA